MAASRVRPVLFTPVVGVISFVLVFISLPFIVINKKDRSKVIIGLEIFSETLPCRNFLE